MLPKIEFKYSRVYDRKQKENVFIYRHLKKRKKSYPSKEEVLSYMKEIEVLWEKEGENVLKSISKNSGLKWEKTEMICYVVGLCRPFSAPLTIPIIKDKEQFIDIMTHELIHKIQSQNKEKWKNWKKIILKEYTNEPTTTRSHIFLYAVHFKVFLDIYNKERLEKHIKSTKAKDYIRAINIVKEKTPEVIIKTFN